MQSVADPIYRIQARTLLQDGILQGSLSHLETLALAKKSTKVDYLARILFFYQLYLQNLVSWSTKETLDVTVLNCLDELFWKTACPSEGSKLLASLKFLIPAFFQSAALRLPRSTKAVKVWMSKKPPLQRIPFPWFGLTAVLGVLCNQSKVGIALNLLIQFISCLRPGVCDQLLVNQLIPPTANAGSGYQM